MREVLVLGILMAGLWGTEDGRAAVPAKPVSGASRVECRDLVKELRIFQTAQSSLMRGFAQKNETLAETLDLYSSQFKSRKGILKKSDYVSLNQSADAFRSHGQRELNLVGRFETTSGALLNQVARCLESTATAVSTLPSNQ